MKELVNNILKSSNKIIITAISIKVIVFILIIFAYSDQPSRFYVLLRWILFISFLLLAFLDQQRDIKITIYFWVSFATFFNPLIPIYFNDKEIWQSIDSYIIFAILITMFFYEIIRYNAPLAIAEHIMRNGRKRHFDILNYLLGHAEFYYYQSSKVSSVEKRNRYLMISEEIFDILIEHSRENSDFWIKIGIIRSKLYHISSAKSDFEYACRINKNIKYPTDEEIHKLTFDNYKDKLSG